MMLRTFVPFCLFVGLLMPSAARADESMKEALSLIPGDAMGFICVPNLKQLDTDYQQAVIDLGLQDMVPPMANSLVGMIRGQLPFLAGLDESGPLVVVFMPAAMIFELQQKQALLIPTKDPKAMLEGMGGVAGEEGLWNVNLMGQPMVAAQGENRLILGQAAQVVKAIKDNKGGIGAKLKASDIKALEGLDLAIWLDAEKLFPMIKPMVDMGMNMAMQAQAAGGGFPAKSAEMNKKQLDLLFEGASSLTIGLDLGKKGLVLRGAARCKPGTELAKLWNVKPTDDSLLRGLHAGDYIVVYGQTVSPEQSQANLENIDMLLSILEEPAPVDAQGGTAEQPAPKNEHIEKLKAIAREWLPLMTRMQGAVDLLTPGDAGLVGMSMVVEATDSAKWLDYAAQTVDVVKALVKSKADGGGSAEWQAEVGQILDAISYARNAEEIGGQKFDHLRFDLTKLGDEIEEDQLEAVNKIIGADGLLVRMAAVDGHAVVIGVGGGAKYTGAAVKAWKEKNETLAKDAGIKKVSDGAPQGRYAEAYVAVDNCLTLIQNVASAMEEEALPVQMADVTEPLALFGTGGDGFIQLDAVFPTELLVAGKNVVMTLMAPPPPPPATAPADSPTTEEEQTP